MKLFALLAVAQAITVSEPIPEASSNPTVEDRTGTYSPKENMWTGFEGGKTGHEITFTHESTGGHASVVRAPSNSNHRNAVNEGGAHQRAN